MRLLLLLSLAFVSCSAPAPRPPSESTTATSIEASVQVGRDEVTPPALPAPKGPIPPPSLIRTSLGGIPIHAVTFDSRSHFLAVADQPGGPASKWPDCRVVGKSLGGIAVINAGFFTPEGAPLGKVISNGINAGGVNRASSLGAGFYVRSSDGRMDLIRREQFNGGDQALQSGPFLVERGRAIGQLSDKQSSARSFIAHDGGTQWIIACTGACSLKSLANALAGQSIGSIRLESVLNLDGGRSSELWASEQISNGPHFQRPIWNKNVRNYLVLKTL